MKAVTAIIGGLAICAVTLLSVPPVPVSAHCPGTPGHEYALGWRTSSTGADAIRTDIEWTIPTVCSSRVSHSVTVADIGQSGQIDGFVQVGWRYLYEWQVPHAYCEFRTSSDGAGDEYLLVDYVIPAEKLEYKWSYNAGRWNCRVDGDEKMSRSGGWMGFTRGPWMPIQGEAHQAHVEIGETDPERLFFTDIQFRKWDESTWTTLAMDGAAADYPYGADNPEAGKLKVWTNPHDRD